MGKRKNTNRHQIKANKARNKKVKLYEQYVKKDKALDNYIEEQEEKVHPYMVRKYGDINFRKEIIEQAIENSYPEDALEELQIYTKPSVKWDLNISDQVIEKFDALVLYNDDAKKQKGFWKQFIDRLYDIFHRGGDDK